MDEPVVSKTNERKEPGKTCFGRPNSRAERWVNVRSKAKRNNPFGAGGNIHGVVSFTSSDARAELFYLLCKVLLRVLDNKLRNLYYLSIVIGWIDLARTVHCVGANLTISNLLGAHLGTVATIPPSLTAIRDCQS